ncbi:hypothetical protein QBC34DRAFT_465197, partial [Podospora aff. communis PSN243]
PRFPNNPWTWTSPISLSKPTCYNILFLQFINGNIKAVTNMITLLRHVNTQTLGIVALLALAFPAYLAESARRFQTPPAPDPGPSRQQPAQADGEDAASAHATVTETPTPRDLSWKTLASKFALYHGPVIGLLMLHGDLVMGMEASKKRRQLAVNGAMSSMVLGYLIVTGRNEYSFAAGAAALAFCGFVLAIL